EKALYLEPVFAKKSFFPGGKWPAEMIAGRKVEYKKGDCPVAEDVLGTAIRINISETLTADSIDKWIEKIKKQHQTISKK
nr:hypothetical protein [Candidatus Sigynarchaeota archaeon]